MAKKSDFTEQMGVDAEGRDRGGSARSLSDRSFFDTFKEAGVLGKHLAQAKHDNASEFIRELADTHGTGFGLTTSPDKVERETLEALQNAKTTLASKAPDELDLVPTVRRRRDTVGSPSGRGRRDRRERDDREGQRSAEVVIPQNNGTALLSSDYCRSEPGLRSTPNNRHSPGIPFDSWRPRSSKSIPEPATRSLTVLDTTIWPPSAFAVTRLPCVRRFPRFCRLRSRTRRCASPHGCRRRALAHGRRRRKRSGSRVQARRRRPRSRRRRYRSRARGIASARAGQSSGAAPVARHER